MSSKKTFYITTPIYYINDVPHIGHAYCNIASDILARYKELKGYDTFFLTGSDENSQKTIEAAKKEGQDIQKYTDGMSKIWKKTWKKMNLTNNDFIRTTEKRHHDSVLKVFKKVFAQDDIYKGKYEGPYCWKCETFYKESDLQDGKCPQHLSQCERIEEANYFFRLSKYEDQLLEYYETHPDFIQPEYRRREVISFVKGGLEDISVSRIGQKWGISMPEDPEHVFYVWFDALINYISGIGYDKEDKPKYWPADFHVIGKDIVRFHCVIWPAMLMSAGIEIPKSIFIHGFFTINGQKISKSLGNAIDPLPIIKRFGQDALRYYFFAEFAFGQDGDFSFSSMVRRINTELADDLGNLLSRTVSMTLKFSDGLLEKGEFNQEEDGHFPETAKEIVNTMDDQYNHLQYSKILGQVWKFFRLANKYAEDQKPWKLAKDPAKKKRLQAVLYNLAETLRFASYVIRPIMPETADKILDQLGVSFEKNYEKALIWGSIPEKTHVEKKEALFPKIELKEDDPFFNLGQKANSAPKNKTKDSKKSFIPKEEPLKETIEFDDFMKVDMRIGKILEAEKIKKSKKLLKLLVDLGSEKRQLVSGIAGYYEPKDIIGKNVVILANLKARKIMGFESQGMLLAACNENQVMMISPDQEILPGASVT